MGDATYNQTNFTAGQLSKLVYGRTDFSKFYNGVATLSNFIVQKQGPITRRPGTKYVADAKNSTGIKRFKRFQFSTSQSYALEFGDLYIRFYRNRDQLMDDGSLKSDGASSTPFELETLYSSSVSKSIVSSTYAEKATSSTFSGAVFEWGESDLLVDGIARLNFGVAHGLAVGDYFRITDVVVTGGASEKRSINTVHTALAIIDANTVEVAVPADVSNWSSGGTSQSEGLATIDVGSSHGFTDGMLVDVSGTGQSHWDGRYRIRRSTATTITVPLNANTAKAVSNAVWSGGPDIVTLTVAIGHGVRVGDTIITTNFGPAAMNDSFVVTAVTSMTIVFALTPDPTISDTTGFLTVLPANGTVTSVDTSVDKLYDRQSADVVFLGMDNERPQELQRLEGFTVSNASYNSTFNGGTATLTIATEASPHGFKVHNPAQGVFSKIIVSGMVPTEYNGCHNITAATDYSVSYTLSPDPGPMTTNGSVDGWQVVRHSFKDGPYLDENLDDDEDFTITNSGDQDAQLTIGSKIIIDGHDVGRWFKHKQSTNDWGNGEIVFRLGTSGFMLNPDFNANFTNGAGSRWRLGAWSDVLGWPWTMSFLQGRLAWGGSNSFNATFWASVSNDINNHRPFDKNSETVNADDGIVRSIDDDLVNAIYWMLNTPKGLIIGTDSAEFLIGQTSTSEALSNNNIESNPQTFFGSKRYVLPVRVGDTAILFVQRAGRKLIELLYSFDVDKFASRDLTVLSENITKSGIIDVTYVAEPSPLIWCALENGKMACCTYEREQDVVSWHEHEIGGTAADGDDRPKVKSVTSVFDESGNMPLSQLWMITRRKVNGSTVEYIEFMEDPFDEGDDIEDAFFVDAGTTYDGVPATTIPVGLHLEGETVKVLADGIVISDKVVDGSGNITLSVAASKVHAGLSYSSKVATLPIEIRQAQPESTKKIKRMERAHVHFVDSQGVQFGVNETDLEDVEFNDTSTLHTGLVEDILVQANSERDTQFWLVNSGVLPTTIGSIVIESEVQPIQD